MKLNIYNLFLTAILFMATKAYSEPPSESGNQFFGARLSIKMTNSPVSIGSKIFLQCSVTNSSTNNITFIQTVPQAMFDVILTDDSGQNILINDSVAATGDFSERGGGVKNGEIFECPIPLLFDKKIKSGHYQMTARQRVFLVKNFDRKNMIHGELVSNKLDVEVK